MGDEASRLLGPVGSIPIRQDGATRQGTMEWIVGRSPERVVPAVFVAIRIDRTAVIMLPPLSGTRLQVSRPTYCRWTMELRRPELPR
jgi:hypothetical protein